MVSLTRDFTLMAKPSSSLCNIHCQYCFYVDKDLALQSVMSDEVLDAYVKQYLAANSRQHVDFMFQGGEPTLCGLDFFQKVISLQAKYGQGRDIQNHLQTNGLLLNEDWAAFFKEHNFLVGLSIDGPEALHDANRMTRTGLPTYQKVINALKLLQKYKVEFNTLTVVSSANAQYGQVVYEHLVDLGSTYLQFIPLTGGCQKLTADEYAKFMLEVCHAWFKQDSGLQQGISIQLLEQMSLFCLGYQPPLCIFRSHCGEQLILEQNGDVYACDHFVGEHFKLGNILECELIEIVNEPALRNFASLKARLPQECFTCPWLELCQGGCPAHRQAEDPADYTSYQSNSLCHAYQQIFEQVMPLLHQLLSKQGFNVVR